MLANKPPVMKAKRGRPRGKRCLVKSPDWQYNAKVSATPKKWAKIVRFTTDDFNWQCWQCLSAFSDNVDLNEHLKICDARNAGEESIVLPSGDTLPGCPFCPRDGCQAELKPYYFLDFNNHIEAQHKDVKELSCPYCTDKIGSTRLEVLTSHILLEHQFHWRPSPASMVYQRSDDVVHRVVTCLGCGWCTFVLRAQDAVLPPASLASHMSRCTGRGGRLSVPRLPPNLRRLTQAPPRALVNDLLAQSTLAGDAFAVRFPGVRGFVSPLCATDANGETVAPVRRLKYQSLFKKESAALSPLRLPPEDKKESPEVSKPSSEEVLEPEDNLPNGKTPKLERETSSPPQSLSPPPKQQQQKKKAKALATTSPGNGREAPTVPTLNQFVPKGIFDVPLDLPPSPPPSALSVGDSAKKTGCLYVCPICGDNALSSLRERDKHLQSEHVGELVFPCQLCGMAYPVYIALRRHAVRKHSSNYDAVLYGQPDMEPAECPYCELVAFTSPEVLQLHLAKIHPEQFEHQTVVSAVASALAGSDSDDADDADDKDWTENGRPPPASQSAATVSPVVATDGVNEVKEKRSPKEYQKGAYGGENYSSADLLDNPDLLERVESNLQFRQSITSRGRRGRGRTRSRGVVYRGVGRARGASRGVGRGRPRGASRGMARGRPRGRGRGRGSRTSFADRVLLTETASALDFNGGNHPETCTILTDAEGRPISDSSVVCSGAVVHTPPPNAVSAIEVILAQTPANHAPVTCRLCGPQAQIVLDNAKEFCIHMELDHNPESTCEQLGCQACGRIFFGPHHRSDLIGHFRVSHQMQEPALSCPNSCESVQLLSPSGLEEEEGQLKLAGGGCLAKFTSARLRDNHLMATGDGWSCPLQLESEVLQAVTVAETAGTSTSFDTMVLATEIAADAAGQMVLAYGCPLCSRVFIGENCTARYLAHRTHCDALIAGSTGVVVGHPAVDEAPMNPPQDNVVIEGREV